MAELHSGNHHRHDHRACGGARSGTGQMGRVIDAHVHFWNPGLLRYPWLAETPTLRRAFLPEHFAPLADGAVDGVIVVEANCESSQAMTEVEFVDGLTAREPRVLASVAYVDLLDEDSRGETLRHLSRRD